MCPTMAVSQVTGENLTTGRGPAGGQGRRTCLCQRVTEFSMCSRSAQLLILENGGWDRLDEWLRAAIHCQNAQVIKNILRVVLEMPTPSGQLLRTGLATRIRRLMTDLAQGSMKMLPLVGEEDRASVKLLCAEVFVKSLLLKKHKNGETPDLQGRMIFEEVDSGKKIQVEALEHRPGFGLLAKDGQISLINLTLVDQDVEVDVTTEPPVQGQQNYEPEPETRIKKKKRKSKVEAGNSCGTLLNDSSEKSKKEETSGSFEDELLLKAVEPEIQVDQVGSTTTESSQLKTGSNLSNALPVDMISSLEDTSKSMQLDPIRLGMSQVDLGELGELHNFESDSSIGLNLGLLQKHVHWWGRDGVKKVHYFPVDDCDYYEERKGRVKEKWISEFGKKIPWKLRKIQVAPSPKPRVRVYSEESLKQKYRESYTPEWNPVGDSILRDSPFEPDEDEDVQVITSPRSPIVIPGVNLRVLTVLHTFRRDI